MKKNRNIVYRTKEISRFYGLHRQRWEEFYPSEQHVFKLIASKRSGELGDVLDVGCACAGLAVALKEKFKLNSYTGIDINKEAIAWAKKHNPLARWAQLISGDILSAKINHTYDMVVSLSCADWNIETKRIIEDCWKRVKTGGYFVISLRLVPLSKARSIRGSYQYINFSAGQKKGEIAPYLVLNFSDALKMFKKLNPLPGKVGAYGYWGKPSPTAVTPFKDIVFSVFYLYKNAVTGNASWKLSCDLPPEITLKAKKEILR